MLPCKPNTFIDLNFVSLCLSLAFDATKSVSIRTKMFPVPFFVCRSAWICQQTKEYKTHFDISCGMTCMNRRQMNTPIIAMDIWTMHRNISMKQHSNAIERCFHLKMVAPMFLHRIWFDQNNFDELISVEMNSDTKSMIKMIVLGLKVC